MCGKDPDQTPRFLKKRVLYLNMCKILTQLVSLDCFVCLTRYGYLSVFIVSRYPTYPNAGIVVTMNLGKTIIDKPFELNI